MPKSENVGRARELYENQPTGICTPKEITPWIVRCIQFLLARYIRGD